MNTDKILSPEDRAIPPCPHFGPCGGCQLQDLTYPAQLAMKATQLRTLLEPTNIDLPELHIHSSPPFAYRNRVRLSLVMVDDELRAGYIRAMKNASEPDALSILPICECPIAAPILWRTTEAFLALMNRGSSDWLCNPQRIPDQLELFTNADESRLLLTLYLRTSAKTLLNKLAPAFTTLCETLRTQIPELTGGGISLLPAASTQRSRRTEVPRPGPEWGAPGLHYTIASHAPDQPATNNPQPATYWVPRAAFFQINRFLIPELLHLVTANRAGALAWDLYAGVGLFSKSLAGAFTQVTAVEIAEPAFNALASTKLPNLHAIKSTTLDYLRAAVLQRDRPGLIVLDPPRTGAGPQICGLLARIAAPTLVYVSCSPQTLPTDLAILTASGYTVSQLHLIDLFPQTSHIETVAILTR